MFETLVAALFMWQLLGRGAWVFHGLKPWPYPSEQCVPATLLVLTLLQKDMPKASPREKIRERIKAKQKEREKDVNDFSCRVSMITYVNGV